MFLKGVVLDKSVKIAFDVLLICYGRCWGKGLYMMKCIYEIFKELMK